MSRRYLRDAATSAAWFATGPMTGSLVVEGGAAIRAELQCARVHVETATAATSATSGALVVAGGAGIAGAAYIGDTAHMESTVDAAWAAGAQPGDAPTLNGALQVAGGASVAKGLHSLTAHVHSSADSLSVDSGAAVVDGGLGVAKNITASSTHLVGNVASTSTTSGTLTVSGGVGINGDMYVNNTYNMSDERLKKNIEVIPDALERVCKLRGCTFDWNENSRLENTPSVGVIAQDVEAVAPRCINVSEETGYKAVEYTKLVPYLIESVKALKATADLVPLLSASVESLKRRCDALGMDATRDIKRRRRHATD